MLRTLTFSAILAISSVSLLACDDDGGSSGIDFSGIWTVTSHTLNETGCTAPGDELAEGDRATLLGIDHMTFMGIRIVEVNACADDTECTEEMTDDDIEFLGGSGNDASWMMEQKTDTGWATQGHFYSQSGEDQPCTGMYHEIVLTKNETGDTLTMEVRSWPFELPAGTGTELPNCDDSDVASIAKANTCSKLEVVTATLN